MIPIILAWRLDGFVLKIPPDLREHDGSSHRETCSIREQASIDRRLLTRIEVTTWRARKHVLVRFRRFSSFLSDELYVWRDEVFSAWRENLTSGSFYRSDGTEAQVTWASVPLVDFVPGPPYSCCIVLC